MSNDLTTFACTISAVVAVFQMHIFKSILCASEFATRSVPARIQLCINATEICIIPLLALIFCSTICVLCKLTAGPNILLHDRRVVYDADFRGTYGLRRRSYSRILGPTLFRGRVMCGGGC